MLTRNSKRRRKDETLFRRRPVGLFMRLWEAFWYPPFMNCPKCGAEAVNYYDPLFFSPLRAIAGKRRMRCSACKFVWRPSRSGQTLGERFRTWF
jgi:rubredoxin